MTKILAFSTVEVVMMSVEGSWFASNSLICHQLIGSLLEPTVVPLLIGAVT